ncbi:signal peptidase II [Caldisericum exile]|uniref:Lipoprotein signal peptidase n=1 Tax=Caldisericum exile (strain DSM 21853 / NBRC 104410 / AZM16c01) TaxID=511051 RepID=A0A7U6GFA5_CALEA|nr:signal peptidase II [Caldisericum exile]BAL81340.1 lipoprotein signal peptidase [Caldisericum exile AZM16c01]
MKNDRYFYIIALSVLIIDQLSKIIVRKTIPTGKEIPLIKGIFSLTHITNSGSLFGMFQNATSILIVSSFFVTFLIIYIERKINLPYKEVAFGLIMGGILGNLIDRIIFRQVTDFLFLKHWPVFNIADASIDIGIAIFIISYLKHGK